MAGARRTAAVVVGALLAVLLAIGTTGFLAWWFVGGGVWRAPVDVSEVRRSAAGGLELIVESCNGAPEVRTSRTIDGVLEVTVVANSTPLRGGGDCLDLLEVEADDDIREVRDLTSGQTFPAETAIAP